MSVLELDQWLQTWLFVLLLLLFIGWVSCLARAVMLRRPWLMWGPCAVSLAFNWVWLELLMDASHTLYSSAGSGIGLAVLQLLPAWAVLLLFTSSAVLLLFCMLDLRWVRAHRITAFSVGDAVNDLPTGLCFYRASGRVLLANDAIDSLSLTLCGSTVLNGAELWRLVRHEPPNGRFTVVTREGDPILTLPDGRSFCFRRREKELRGKKLWELTTSDVTEETELSRRLQVEKQRLERQRDRQLRYGELVEEAAAEKELLAAKVKIHDELGGALLAARRYLALRDPADRAELIRTWERSIRLLQEGETTPSPARGYRAELQAAADVGVHVELEGPLPEAEPALSVLRCALSECTTNTFRHAGGNVLTVLPEEGEAGWRVCFSNNGRPPEGEIREGGGLGNLRRLCESSGGSMRIESSPGFLLELWLPKEENHAL